MEIFSNNNFIVHLVSDFKEAQALGNGSGMERMEDGGRRFHPFLEWCISVMDDDHARQSFESYTRTVTDVNPCYFIISRTDPLCQKYCIIPSRNRFHRPGAFVDNLNIQMEVDEMESIIGKDLMDQIREDSRKWFENRPLYRR